MRKNFKKVVIKENCIKRIRKMVVNVISTNFIEPKSFLICKVRKFYMLHSYVNNFAKCPKKI